MQSYYLSGSNTNTFRIEQTTNPTFTMHYENMMTLTDVTQSLSAQYTSSQSIIRFDAEISGAYDGAEYRAYLEDGEIVSLLEFSKRKKLSYPNLLNKAKRQTIEAFLEKDEWKIAIL